MRRLALALLFAVFTCFPAFAQKLLIYAIDTEGGKATLIVTPEKESLLIDAGWPYDSRDADRIAAAAKDAGITRIDYLLVTHYHIDHVGGVPWLLERMPVAHIIDHGPTVEHDNHAEQLYAAYERATAKIPRTIVGLGETIPVKGVDIQIVADGGETFHPETLARTVANPLCRMAVAKPPENDENDQSIGLVLRFGKFSMVDLVDLTAGKEPQLLCPANVIGKAELFMVSHHGLDRSNSPLLIGSLQPRVAIMNNGASKGGSLSVIKALNAAPGFEGLWMLHAAPGDTTTAPKFIANPDANCRGYGIKVVALPDGAFTVSNQRTGVPVTYTSAK